jgi:hypothetical protein
MFSPATHTRLIFERRLRGIDVSSDVYIMTLGSQISQISSCQTVGKGDHLRL